jgi:hypothetical protein
MLLMRMMENISIATASNYMRYPPSYSKPAIAARHSIMTKQLFLFSTGFLIGFSRAFSASTSFTTAALSTFEHYCFPKTGGPFFPDSIWPSVTMMYSGITLTTTPITFTISGVIPTTAPAVAINSIGSSSSPGNSKGPMAVSSASNGAPSSSLSKIWSSGEATFRSFTSDQAVLSSSSVAFVASQSTSSASPMLSASSQAAIVSPSYIAGSSNSLITGSGMKTVSRDATNTDRMEWVSSTGVSDRVWDAHSTTNSDSNVALVTPTRSVSSPISEITGGTKSDPSEQLLVSASASPTLPTNMWTDPVTGGKNASISLSPQAIDALQLAQYIKNFGISMFSTNSSDPKRSDDSKDDISIFATLIANISKVSYGVHASF